MNSIFGNSMKYVKKIISKDIGKSQLILIKTSLLNRFFIQIRVGKKSFVAKTTRCDPGPK